jgi:integrase
MAIFKQKSSKGTIYGVRIWHDGKDIRKVIGSDRKQAELVEAALIKEIRESKAVGQQWTGLEAVRKAKRSKSFAEAAQDYMDERANFKPSTIQSYQCILKNYLLPVFGKLPLRSVTEGQVAKFQATIAQKISPIRTNTIMQLLRSIMDTAVRRNDISSSPAKNVRRVPELRAKVDPLSEAEIDLALLNVDRHYRALFTMLAFTGARPNELLALR